MDKVIGHGSETARRFYLLNDREQDARNTLEVASVLSPPTATETPTVKPERRRNWGSGRPLEDNQKRGFLTLDLRGDERIGVQAKQSKCDLQVISFVF